MEEAFMLGVAAFLLHLAASSVNCAVVDERGLEREKNLGAPTTSLLSSYGKFLF